MFLFPSSLREIIISFKTQFSLLELRTFLPYSTPHRLYSKLCIMSSLCVFSFPPNVSSQLFKIYSQVSYRLCSGPVFLQLHQDFCGIQCYIEFFSGFWFGSLGEGSLEFFVLHWVIDARSMVK